MDLLGFALEELDQHVHDDARAGHGMSFFEDTERYVSDIRAFTENCKARCPST